MKQLLSLGIAALALAPPIVSQNPGQTLVVNPTGSGPYTTITAAAAAAQPGDIILVDAMPSPDWAYSENHLGGTEQFPISIAHGVTLRGNTLSGTVMIWSTAATSPSALIELKGSSSANVVTRIEDLTIIGAKRGIRLDSGSFNEFSGIIARCDFGRNRIAVDDQHGSEALASLAIRDCRIGSELPAFLPPLPPGVSPVLRPSEVGIRLKVDEAIGATGSPPQLEVEIKNLTTHGNFSHVGTAGMSSFPPTAQGGAFSSAYFTRLIECAATGLGAYQEHGATGLNAIPEVRVSVIGGALEGKATSVNPDHGWDVGIYAVSDSDGAWKDFVSGVSIDIAGTTIDGFRHFGLYGRSWDWSRVAFDISGNTSVREIARQAAVQGTPDVLHSGALLETKRGYVNLAASNANFSDNTHSGIVLVAEESPQADDIKFPAGNRIDLHGCELHQNGRSGIEMRPVEGGSGIVGGTWHFVNFEKSLLHSPSTSFSVDYGQGVIDACSISNNGEHGIFVLAPVSGLTVSTRATNTIIWNNAGSGFEADFRNLSEAAAPTILFPMEHCTVAGNQTWSYRVQRATAAGGSGLEPNPFYWENSTTGEVVRTALYNTIFEMQSPTTPDFNDDTWDILKFDHDQLNPVAATEIGVSSLRYKSTIAQGNFGDFYSTQDATPFADASDWTTLDATRFYLASVANPSFDLTRPVLTPIAGNETDSDHGGDSRPSEQAGDRDKGAEQYP